MHQYAAHIISHESIGETNSTGYSTAGNTQQHYYHPPQQHSYHIDPYAHAIHQQQQQQQLAAQAAKKKPPYYNEKIEAELAEFKIEIEEKFAKSKVNRDYVFPLKSSDALP